MRVNIAFMTSCRELSRSESVGRVVRDPVSGAEYGKRVALVEAMAREIAGGREAPLGRLDLRAIIVDDGPEEFAVAWRHGTLWNDGYELCPGSSDGASRPRTLASLTHLVPSTPFRTLKRMAGEDPECFRLRKAVAKQAYEQRVLSVLEREKVDLVISDSYMLVFTPTILDQYRGRMLNVHPGITSPEHPARLPGATPTRDAYTRAVHGYIIVDDKAVVDAPAGPRVPVEFEGRTRLAVRVPPLAETGVTVHEITEEVDGGPVIACQTYTFDPAGISMEGLRARNYDLKLAVLRQAAAKIL